MARRWNLDSKRETIFLCRYGGEELVVKRVSPGSWFARIRGTKEHARWGDARQIREDISYFYENCVLPRGKRMW